MTTFLLAAVLLTVLGVGLVAWPLLRAGPHRSPLAAMLAVLVIPALVWFLYPKVSSYDWVKPPAKAGDPAAQQTRSIDEAIIGLERRLSENPSDEEGWVLLGSSYLALRRPADAVQAYRRAVELSNGNNMAARLGAAEAQIAENPASLSGAAGQEIEAILEREPGNPKALWYGGMLALSRGDITTVRSRWQALLDLDPPAEIQQIIAGQLAQLDTTQPTLQAGSSTQAAESTSIDIQVSVSPGLREQITPSALLFIFVRDPAKPGPPMAVVRRLASELPLSLRISNADLMLPGGPGLGALKSAALVARVANAGDPVAQAGDLFGQASWSGMGATGATISIVIDQVVN